MRRADHLLGHAATDEHRVGPRQARDLRCRIATYRLEPGYAMCHGIGVAAIELRLVAVDGIGDPARRIS